VTRILSTTCPDATNGKRKDELMQTIRNTKNERGSGETFLAFHEDAKCYATMA
jgi:hypothetical protein